MNLLIDTYIFYADVYFIQNFLIKVMVLYLSLYCNKIHYSITTVKGVVKILFASCIGTVLEIAGLFRGNSYNLFLIFVHLFEIPFMVWFVTGKDCRQKFRVIVTGYFFVIVINGVLEILWNTFGDSGNYIFFLCVACGSVYAGVRLWISYSKMRKGIFPIEIQHAEERIFTYGFYDSGNHLKDPYTGKGVHIISGRLLKQLPILPEKKVCVPFQALGENDGLIDVYYLDTIHIYLQSKEIIQQKVPMGITQEELFHGKQYEIILNEDIW